MSILGTRLSLNGNSSSSSGLYCKHITIENYNSRVVNKFEASLTDDARVVIYDRHTFILQDTGAFRGKDRLGIALH